MRFSQILCYPCGHAGHTRPRAEPDRSVRPEPRAFAQEIGLDDSKLSKSLSGTRRFSSLDLARIADRCHVTVDWLITGEEPPLAVAARTTSGDARTALEAAKRYSTMRGDLASLGWPQPWRPVSRTL